MPTNPAATAAFSQANPHAVAAIVQASATREIVASRDILDLQGIKLWARDQPVSQSLQQRLVERRLRHPLESCLRAEDGVTTHTLIDELQLLVESGHPLARVVKPHAKALEQEIAFHYNQFPGRFQATGDTDEELQFAVKVLSDGAMYKSFFEPGVKWR
jgi:hypothetical protein